MFALKKNKTWTVVRLPAGRQAIRDLLCKEKMQEVKPNSTFMTSGQRLSAYGNDPIEDVQLYSGTQYNGLHLKQSASLDLKAFCDADWATDCNDRRSTSGFAVFLGSTLITWKSKKQHTILGSSTQSGSTTRGLM
uniref:Mitochondrial protein n=1 Tax=Cannabis sativa TaxID=3483 RepID=A0A803PVT3_CANSA